MLQHTPLRLLAIAAATALVFTACGGDDDDAPSGGGRRGGSWSATGGYGGPHFPGGNPSWTNTTDAPPPSPTPTDTNTPTDSSDTGSNTSDTDTGTGAASGLSASVTGGALVNGNSPEVQEGKSSIEITLSGDPQALQGNVDVRVELAGATFPVPAGSTSQTVTFTNGVAVVLFETEANASQVTLSLFAPPDASNTTAFDTITIKVVSSGGTDECAGVAAPGAMNVTQPATLADRCAILKAHNDARAAVKVPALKWSDAAATVAYNYAKTLAGRQTCADWQQIDGWGHSGTSGYGENLAAKMSSTQISATVIDGVQGWLDEGTHYTYSSNSCVTDTSINPAGTCGHYTQVVWRDTTEVGCGYAEACSGRGQKAFLVCNYTPPGNVSNGRPY